MASVGSFVSIGMLSSGICGVTMFSTGGTTAELDEAELAEAGIDVEEEAEEATEETEDDEADNEDALLGTELLEAAPWDELTDENTDEEDEDEAEPAAEELVPVGVSTGIFSATCSSGGTVASETEELELDAVSNGLTEITPVVGLVTSQ